MNANPSSVLSSLPMSDIAMHKSSNSSTWTVYLPSSAECSLATDLPWFRETFQRHVLTGDLVRLETSPERANLVVIFERWAEKNRQSLCKVLDYPFLRQYAPKTYVISHDDFTVGLFPGCYTSLTRARFDPGWHRSCPYPGVYHWDPSLEQLRHELDIDRKRLFSFRGSVTSHTVRRRIQLAVAKDPRGSFTAVHQAFHTHTSEQVVDYVREILESDFVLCPRGISPSTYRMYEVMQLGRCPVVISDDWIAPDGPDWNCCSIRIREADVDHLPQRLEQYSDRAAALGAAARQAWETWFSEGPRFVGLFESILELHLKRRGQQASSVQALRTRMDAWRFRWNAGWTAPQRMARGLLHRK